MDNAKYKSIAMSLLEKHTEAYFSVSRSADDINAMTVEDMHEEVSEELAFILTDAWVKGEYTTREYYLIRAELATILDTILNRDMEVDPNPGF